MYLKLVNLRQSKRALLVVCTLCVTLFFASNIIRTPLHIDYTWLLGRNEQSETLQTEFTPWSSLDSLKPCPEYLVDPVGPIQVNRTVPSWNELHDRYIKSAQFLNQSYSASQPNGTLLSWPSAYHLNQTGNPSLGLWSPVECRPTQTVAVIIPFRAREAHLRVFLNHMHTFFRHQQMLYSIFVIEQVGKTIFNRAALFNVGFVESSRLAEFDCFIFHDVDLLPQDDRLLYRCRDQPIHLSVALDRYDYKLLYATLFGGAVAITREQFKRVRGFSNCFFGWGGEDDDMYIRVSYFGYQIFRHSSSISRYTMLSHARESLNQPNPARHKLLLSSKWRLKLDGYPETEYKVISAKPVYDGLVYWISVDLAEEHIKHKCNLTKS